MCRALFCRFCIRFIREKIADVGRAPCEYIVIESLLPVNVVDGCLDSSEPIDEFRTLACKEFFALGDGGDAAETECEVFLHFGKSHAAVSEADKAFQPPNIVIVENTVIVCVTLDVRQKALIAVEFQCLIAHSCRFTGSLHCIYDFPPKNFKKGLRGSCYRLL